MTTLKPGDTAPDIESLSYDNQKISLKNFKGQKVILFFYPKDNTPGCTAEACNLRDNYALLKQKGFAIIGVSADNAKSHLKFSEKFSLPFPLIADTEKNILKSYGVWGTKKFMGRTFDGIHRTTFVIDENGIISHVFEKVETANHSKQILDAVGM